MQTKWKTDRERLLEYMRILPKKKLEWLRAMNDFNRRFLGNRQKKIRQALRQSGEIM